TLQTKTPGQTRKNSHSEKSDLTKRHQNWHQKTTGHTLNGKKNATKNNKQKPPNTLLSSQTTDQIVPSWPL
ncbi:MULTISPECIES: hypothetical protein, partial [unclassified Mycolicibacterium]|uniref:hypothetical protein n=1 Tax=unclassified Mycolicibacterium TaxID=2636767 RepID=UPI002ED7E3EB